MIDSLLALSRVFVGHAARSLAGLDDDVTLQQIRTLVVLVSKGPQRIIDLAHELQVTSSTATRMCNRLERKDLVRRHERPQDRRAAWVGLTPAGRDLVGHVTRRRRAAIAALVAQLSMTRPLAFAAVLDAVVEAAEEPSDAQWWQRWETAAAAESADLPGK